MSLGSDDQAPATPNHFHYYLKKALAAGAIRRTFKVVPKPALTKAPKNELLDTRYISVESCADGEGGTLVFFRMTDDLAELARLRPGRTRIGIADMEAYEFLELDGEGQVSARRPMEGVDLI